MAKKSTPNRKYTPEFKADVLRLVANGEPILAVAKKNWASVIASSMPGGRLIKRTKGKKKSTSTLQEEVESLKRQLRQTELEREILKKAVAIFSVADQAE